MLIMLKTKKPTVGLIVLVALVLVAAIIGTTIAYYMITSPTTENTFEVAAPGSLTVNETFTEGDTEKKNVYVTLNGGDTSVYVRAAIVITFQDASGNVLAKVPVKDTDYTIEMGPNWTLKSDGFWYYYDTVAPDTSTTNLIVSCKTLNTSYKLVVEVLAQSIQAAPTDAVLEQWGFIPGEDSGN